MKDKNIMIKLVVGFSLAFAIRFIGIEHIPFIVILTTLLFGIVYFIWSMFRVKEGQKKDKYYIIFACNLIAFAIVAIIMYTIDNKYPKYMSVSRPIFIPIFLILLITTFISVIAWSIASNKK